MKRWIFSLLLLCVFSLIFGVQKTEGHGYIVRSIPSDRSVVTRAPNTVQIWFSEGLEPTFSTIEVFNQGGEQVDLGDGGVDEQNSAKLVVSLPLDLPQGAYLVKMRPAFTSDGHAVNDTLVFWVGEQVGNFDESGRGSTAVPLEAVWRILLTLSLIVFFGTIWTYALVLRPAWGNPLWKLGALPPRLMNRLSLLLWVALISAMLVNGLALIQIVMSLFDTDVTGVFEGDALTIVLQGTNFGEVWQIRMMLLVAMLGVQIVATQQSYNRPGSTHILWLVNGVLALLALGSLSLISHSSGSPIWPVLSVLLDYVHLSAVAAWIGGLIVIALVLRPALQPLSPQERGHAIVSLLKRFSPIAVICVSLIIATGIYAASINLYQPSDFAKSTYGLTLLAKLIVMLPLFALGWVHFIAVSPERSPQVAAWLKARQRFSQLPQTLPVEMLFALVVLIAAAMLPATPPPQPTNARAEIIAEAKSINVEGYDVEVTVSPGAIGANSYDVNIAQNGEPATLERVKIRFSYPARGLYTAPLELESTELGLWVGASGDINRAAEWDVLMDIYPAGDAPIRAATKWRIVEEVANPNRASMLNWLSLVGVVVVGAVWFVPFSYRSAKLLDWTPQIVAVTIASVLFLIGITVGGAIFFNETSRRVAEQRNPAPEIMNSVFADQTSLVQGQTIYENECIVCHGATGSNQRPAILNSGRSPQPFDVALQAKEDADLYRLLSQGTVGRHPYGAELSIEARWHLINFIRQLE